MFRELFVGMENKSPEFLRQHNDLKRSQWGTRSVVLLYIEYPLYFEKYKESEMSFYEVVLDLILQTPDKKNRWKIFDNLKIHL